MAQSCAPANPLPTGFDAIPLVDEASAPGLRLCAVVRQGEGEVADEPVLVSLRAALDARVVLGCLLDAADQVHDWVELWVQDIRQFAGVPASTQRMFTNTQLDARWREQVQAFQSLQDPAFIATGWEQNHPAPLCLDPATRKPVVLTHEQSGVPWQLCQDDALLVEEGLAPYSASAHRYLYLPDDEAAQPRFVALTDGAPRNKRTMEWTSFEPTLAGLVPLNPCGGLMMVRRFAPMGWSEAVDVLGGSAWQGLHAGNTLLDLDQSVRWLSHQKDGEPHRSGRLFLGAHGRTGRIAETLHLKLRLLADAFEASQQWVRQTGRPMFNLTPENFQVRLGAVGRGLPALWTMHASLRLPGEAIELATPQAETAYYLPAAEPTLSIYRPEVSAQSLEGIASVRIRGMEREGEGKLVIEGTLQTDQPIEPTRRDIMWLRLSLAGESLDVYARLERDSALATDEWRFRSVPQPFDEGDAQRLEEAQGVPLPRVAFQLIPLLSTPCDLYALAVLAVRTLLTDRAASLPRTLDVLLSLARQLAMQHEDAGNAGDSTALPQRIRALFGEDPRWLDSLGPQHLVQEEITADEAFDAVPAELWWQVLSWLVRLLPGMGPDSLCRHFGDTAGAPHRVFEPALTELDALLLRSGSLIVVDWRYNREVAGVVRRFRADLVSENTTTLATSDDNAQAASVQDESSQSGV